MHEGGEKCLKYLKGGGPEKRGVEIKTFKKGGKLGQEVDALKGGGGGQNPLANHGYITQIETRAENP